MTGYLYILKHGIGPGTMPNDVTILKEKDLPNYYTAVWLDRFLTTSELKQYDIPSETRINELLDRIDYCQADNGDDVVPCKDIKASIMPKPTVDSVLNLIDDNKIVFKNDVAYWNRGKGVLPKEYRDCIAQTEYAHWINEWSCEQAERYGSRAYYDYDGETDVDACGNITASKIIASKMSDIDLLMREALECTTKDELSAVISGLDSLGLRKLYLHYMEMLRDDSLSVDYIASDLSDTLYNMPGNEVDACGNVMASEYPSVAEFNKLCDYYAGLDPWIPLEEIWDMVNADHGNEDGLADDITAYVEHYRNCMDEGIDSDDVDACDKINASTKSRYFANMVNCSSDPELDDDFLIEGYYDNQRRGLAESAETSDVSALNDLANEYANKGYYLRVTNRYAGVILDIDADDWFDSFYPDGLSEGELE